MVPPTTAQQKGIAYAPMPFAAISFVSSSYVIYHLLFQRPQKLKRLYHRLVLAMNLALLPLSFVNAWSTLAIPEGTPYYAGAIGTANTCAAQGFLKVMFTFTVPTYYASLVLQAFLGVRNNFKEDGYRWIELPIHLVAYCIPCAYASVIAATGNINPSGSGCYYAKYPRGCESDPQVPCERGTDVKYFVYIAGFTNFFLYFIFPTFVASAMHCWIGKIQKERGSKIAVGMSIIRETARKEMMHSVRLQVSLYLFSFWSTWVLSVVKTIYRDMSGDMLYNLTILANCIYALQGFVFMIVYFTLQKMGSHPKVGVLKTNVLPLRVLRHQLTVSEIRLNVKQKSERSIEEDVNNVETRASFNIFDGVPDPDSPWARFFEQDNHSDCEDTPDEG